MMNKLRLSSEIGFSLLLVFLLVACGAGSEGAGDGSNVNLPATTGLLNSITITPATSSVTACVPTQFTATGYYSDGTSKNVTTEIEWQIDSASSGVAIANSANGLIVGISTGTASVNAFSGNIFATASMTVTSGALNSITVTPASSTIARTGTQTYSASATCTNGTLDVSAYNVWSSSATSVASISVSGVATAVAAGSTVITATAGAASASSVLNVQ